MSPLRSYVVNLVITWVLMLVYYAVLRWLWPSGATTGLLLWILSFNSCLSIGAQVWRDLFQRRFICPVCKNPHEKLNLLEVRRGNGAHEWHLMGRDQ